MRRLTRTFGGERSRFPHWSALWRWTGDGRGRDWYHEERTMIGLSHTPLPRNSLAGWILAQLTTLTGWLESDGHRWPPWRVAVALRAIHAGDEHWRDRAAEVLR